MKAVSSAPDDGCSPNLSELMDETILEIHHGQLGTITDIKIVKWCTLKKSKLTKQKKQNSFMRTTILSWGKELGKSVSSLGQKHFRS